MPSNLHVQQLLSASEARVIGYHEGTACRVADGGRPDELARLRRTSFEEHPRNRHFRGPHTIHYRAWRAGFDAGYLGMSLTQTPSAQPAAPGS